MNNNEVIDNNIVDLKVGIDLAHDLKNDILEEYASNRIKKLDSNRNIYEIVPINNVIDSYVIDLALFINISIIVDERESKDYFRGRLISIMNLFPYLKERPDLAKYF